MSLFQRITLLVLSSCLCANCQWYPDLFKNQGQYHHVDAKVEQYNKHYKSSYGRIGHTVDCGGNGEYKHVYVESCEDGDDLCKVDVEDRDHVEFEVVFLPSKNIRQLAHKMEARIGHAGNYDTLYDHTISDSNVKKEKITVVTVDSPQLSKIWKGQKVWIRYTLYNEDLGEVEGTEICRHVHFEIA